MEDDDTSPLINVYDNESAANDDAPVLTETEAKYGTTPLPTQAQDRRKRQISDAGPRNNFETIDWNFYSERYRTEREKSEKRRAHQWWLLRYFLNVYDAVQSWIALAVIGAVVGLIAATIDITSAWAADFKFGYCDRGFWINRGLCCKDSPNLMVCPHWQPWSQHFVADDAGTHEMMNYTFYIVIAVIMASTSALLVKWYAPQSAGSGIPEIKTILGGFVIKDYLSPWSLLIKLLGVILAVGAGLSIGAEGPFVHMGCCVASILSNYFPKYRTNETKKRELISSASAAALSVGFGAPVGGVLFSLEEVSSYFPPKVLWRSFFCAIIAAMTLQRLNIVHSGKIVMFEVTYHHRWKWFELIPFMVLGVIGGLVGATFVKLWVKMARLRKRFRVERFPVLEIMAISFVTAMINYLLVYLRGSSTELLAALFSECKRSTHDVYDELCELNNSQSIMLFLFLAAVLKFFLTVLTAGAQVPLGLFIPSLVMGALIGRLVGFIMYLLQLQAHDSGFFASCKETTNCITPGVYAIIGAASVLCGVTRMTVSLVVIMFELTGGLEYVLPTMVGVMCSKWVADAFGRNGIYEETIHWKNYPYLDNKLDYSFTANDKAKDVMAHADLTVVTMHGNTIASLELLLKTTEYHGYPVVTNRQDMLLIGYISRPILERVIAKARENRKVSDTTVCYFSSALPFQRNTSYLDFSPWLDQFPIQIAETMPLERVIDMFRNLGLRYVLVMRYGQVVGIIKKKDVLAYINKLEH